MSVDTNVKGKNLSAYRTLRAGSTRIHVTPVLIGMVSSMRIVTSGLRGRKLAVAAATAHGGKPIGRAVHNFALQVVELAFVRDRIDRGFGDQRVQALFYEETQAVYAARDAASYGLHALEYFRVPIRYSHLNYC